MNSPARLVRGVWPSRRHDVKSARVCRVFKINWRWQTDVRVRATNVFFVLLSFQLSLFSWTNEILVIPHFRYR